MVEQDDMVEKVLDQWVKGNEVPPKAPSLPVVYAASFPHYFATVFANLKVKKKRYFAVILDCISLTMNVVEFKMSFLFPFLWATVPVLCLIVYRTFGNFSYLFVRALYILRSGLLGAGWHEISAPLVLAAGWSKWWKPCCWRWAAHTRLTFWRTRAAGSLWGRQRTTTVECPCWPGEDPGAGVKGREETSCLQTDLGLHLFLGKTLPLLYHLFSKIGRVLSPSASGQCKCERWCALQTVVVTVPGIVELLGLFIKHLSHHRISLIPMLMQKWWSSQAV